MNEGTIGSMKALGITESYKLKRQVVLSATEAAEMIIRFVKTLVYSQSLIRSQGGRHSSCDPSEARSSISRSYIRSHADVANRYGFVVPVIFCFVLCDEGHLRINKPKIQVLNMPLPFLNL